MTELIWKYWFPVGNKGLGGRLSNPATRRSGRCIMMNLLSGDASPFCRIHNIRWEGEKKKIRVIHQVQTPHGRTTWKVFVHLIFAKKKKKQKLRELIIDLQIYGPSRKELELLMFSRCGVLRIHVGKRSWGIHHLQKSDQFSPTHFIFPRFPNIEQPFEFSLQTIKRVWAGSRPDWKHKEIKEIKRYLANTAYLVWGGVSVDKKFNNKDVPLYAIVWTFPNHFAGDFLPVLIFLHNFLLFPLFSHRSWMKRSWKKCDWTLRNVCFPRVKTSKT